MYLIIDNYDSFTYNIFQYLSELTTEEIRVKRNDKITLKEIEAMKPEGIIISPGPGRPENAGISVEVIKRFAGEIPLLGICLGHQAIGYAYGAKITQARRMVHGKAEDIILDGKGLFRAISSPAVFTRYHSLVIDPEGFTKELEITARSVDGEIMGVRHKRYLVEGIQFHPESIASEYGKKLLKNFLSYRREPFRVKETLIKAIEEGNLTRQEAEGFMEELTEGNLTPVQIAGYLVAINAGGITPEEIAGCASILQRKRVNLDVPFSVLDTCGTGGDGLGTFNISSLAALVASSCGAVVGKHGNRAVSSVSGSADFFNELGVTINLKPEQTKKLMERTGFAFLFAPIYHSAMKHAASARRDLGIKTIMNLLGPLVNPAGAECQLIGVYSEKYCRTIALAAHLLGIKRAMVVHGGDGLDEISVTAPTKIVTVDEMGRLSEQVFTPGDVGVPMYRLEELEGGTAAENAGIAREILNGGGPPAVRDAVLLNAGASLAVYGLADSIEDGYRKARQSLREGKVMDKLDEIIRVSKAITEERAEKEEARVCALS